MLIQQKFEEISLSDAQKNVVEYLLLEREKIKHQTIKEIALASYTSTGTIMRLAKKLGYKGFEDFKEDFLKEIQYLDTHFQNINPNFPFSNQDSIQKISSKITMLAKETLDDTLALVEHDSLQKAISIMKHASHIHLAAISYSLLLGQMFQLDMMRIGVPVNIYPIEGELLFSASLIKEDDCVIFISYSGQIHNLCVLAKTLKERGTKIIVITSLGDNELKQYADVVLTLSTREKLYSKIAGYSNEYSIKLLLDILYSCYFSLDYNENLNRRIRISKLSETGRTASLDIMKED